MWRFNAFNVIQSICSYKKIHTKYTTSSEQHQKYRCYWTHSKLLWSDKLLWWRSINSVSLSHSLSKKEYDEIIGWKSNKTRGRKNDNSTAFLFFFIRVEFFHLFMYHIQWLKSHTYMHARTRMTIVQYHSIRKDLNNTHSNIRCQNKYHLSD